MILLVDLDPETNIDNIIIIVKIKYNVLFFFDKALIKMNGITVHNPLIIKFGFTKNIFLSP